MNKLQRIKIFTFFISIFDPFYYLKWVILRRMTPEGWVAIKSQKVIAKNVCFKANLNEINNINLLIRNYLLSKVNV